jgi:hypothetical protein
MVSAISDPLPVVLFLLHAKRALISEENREIIPREKNEVFLRKYLLRFQDVYDLCLKLTPQDYYSFPVEDDNLKYPSKVCVFKIVTEIHSDQVKIYVKLKLSPDCKHCKVLSFHEFDEF